ncbi:MAG: ATP phosphoribosyltransferase regulatory subunit, partial [Phycisphaerales bacterium]
TKQLPKPVRWFCVPNFFRAEKPQRGRLREFMQWNVDVIGGEPDEAIAHDAEIIGTLIAAMRSLGLGPSHCSVRFSSRHGIDNMLSALGVEPADRDAWLGLLDEAKKIGPIAYLQRAHALPGGVDLGKKLSRLLLDEPTDTHTETALSAGGDVSRGIRALGTALDKSGFAGWHRFDLNIVRGLAYYTGTVFELIAEGERAVAGGGRYDNLVELFGGPSTAACGFGMGDVVLGNLLDDHGLMPADGAEMMDAIQRTVSGVSLRPEVFVVSGGEEFDHLVQPLLANLRAGIEADGFVGKPWDSARFDPKAGGVRPMHARTTAKSTRNLKKLLADAERQYARFVAVIHGEEKVQLKDLDAHEDVGDFAIMPDAQEHPDLPQRRPFVGRAILERLAHPL